MPATVTDRLQGLTTSVAIKPPCATVATSNITLSGLQTINSVALAEGDRVLVTGQTSSVDNGIYIASTSDWTRALDFDGSRDAVKGTLVSVVGTASQSDWYELTTANPVVFGTSAITFSLRYGANARYDRTPAEIAASVVPTSYAYPGDDPRRLASFYPNRGWLDLGDVPTYINNTAPGGSFSVPGDRTSVYVKGRRVRLINSNATSADVRITFSSFAAGITTINVTTADGGGTVSSTMVAVEVQDTCPAYGQLSNVLNYAGVAGAQFFNTDTGATSGARVIIGNVATDGAGAPDTSVSSAIAIVATGGNFSGSYLSNGVAGVPTGRGIWYHTGFPIPLCFGIGDQVRVVMQALGNPFLFLGAGEGFRIVSDRSDNLGGSSFSFFRTNASTRKGYMGFADNGTDNRMDIVNEESGSNVKIGSQQDIWLSPAATGKVYLDNSGGVFVKVGSGSPESVVTAPVGSLFLRTDGGATTTLYVKTSGSGNTGWTAK